MASNFVAFLSGLIGLKKKATCLATVSVLEFVKDKKFDPNDEGVVVYKENITDYKAFKTVVSNKNGLLKSMLNKNGAFNKLLTKLDKDYATQINEICVSDTSITQKKTLTITIQYPPYKITIKITR